MREGWTYKKLGEVCEIEYGTRVVQARDGGSIYPVYGGGGATFMMDSYNREDRVVVSRFAMSKKCTRKVSGKFFLNDSGLTIKSKDPLILQNYLDTFVLSSNDKIYHLGRGLAQKNLKVPDLLQIEIAIPDAKVQQSIVAELDKINELISLKKAQLSDLDSLAQSIFYDMFGDPIENGKGWEVKKLDSIYKVTSSKRVFQEEWKTEGIPFYKVADIVSLINDEKVIPNTFITEAKYNELKLQSLVPNTGDILVTSRGTLGQCYIVKADDQFYFQDGMITWLSAKKVGISPLYIKMLFKTESFLNSLLQKANISTVAYLSINQLANRFIPIPPLSLQQEFAKRIELIEQQKTQISSTIKDLETLLASRMQYWFD